MTDLAHVVWRKASHSGNQGACVEAAALNGARWRKASHSGNQGSCVEVATNLLDGQGAVYVRDSKNPKGAVLGFTAAEWNAFLAGAKDDEFSM